MPGYGRERGKAMNDVLIIRIAGGSGSGKTTLTNQIASLFQEHVTVLKHDNYYKAHDDMTFEERKNLNYDHPNAFDTELMIEHLKELRAGHPVQCPVYDYKVHNRSRDTITVAPSKVIIVEGILIFENKELCDIGLHGPDLLFYYLPLKTNEINSIGYNMHEKTGKEVFDTFRKMMTSKKQINHYLAYYYGFICHFALDATCRGYIEKRIHESGVSHGEIEVEFDRF